MTPRNSNGPSVVRTFFERIAEQGPVVMVFEDLHWADSGTLDFIDHLLDFSRDGARIAFTQLPGTIWVMNADGTGLRKLTAGVDADWR